MAAVWCGVRMRVWVWVLFRVQVRVLGGARCVCHSRVLIGWVRARQVWVCVVCVVGKVVEGVRVNVRVWVCVSGLC